MDRLINYYKRLRTQKHLMMAYKGKYAFVGVGNHSIHNLYPVLNHLNVPLKYIVSKTTSTAELVSENYNGVIGTNDYQSVLNDSEVTGVLICANPTKHYELTKRALAAGKNVFVEKPPCSTIEELRDLMQTQSNGQTCLVGMQKRYSPCSGILKRRINKDQVISYNYRYLTGCYPEGDDLLDIHIHPLDLVHFLFGEYEVISVCSTSSGGDSRPRSVFLHLKHGKTIGSIELSTNYSWSSADESLEVNVDSGVYRMRNHEALEFQKKQGSLFSIPLEKVWAKPMEINVLFNRNSFVPILSNNQLYTMGYYNEVLNFISLCENKGGENLSPLGQMVPTYRLISEINQ